MHKLNDTPININNPITVEGITYPHLRDPQLRAELGVTEHPDPEAYDERFYWGPNNPKQLDDETVTPVTGYETQTITPVTGYETQTITPEEGEPYEESTPVYGEPYEESTPIYGEPYVQTGLKTQHILQVKDTAGKLLAQTDWYVTRRYERGVEIPAEIASKRALVVSEADRLESAISGCANVEELIEVLGGQSWPA
jgi:hypothetical protein